MNRRLFALPLFAALFAVLPGCPHKVDNLIGPVDNVDWQTNGWGLQKLDPKDYPDMRAAFYDRVGLEKAILKSLQYLQAPSSARYYPSGKPGDTITHDQIAATLLDMLDKLHNPQETGNAFQQELLAHYDVYTSIGFDRKGSVWFTGYFTPIYYGSKTPTAEFKYPVYQRPADLVSDPVTGEVKGRQLADGSIQPYPTRGEIEKSGMLHGLELAYFRDPMEPYIIQVQGSAKVILPDGQQMMIGYAGKNGRDYHGLGAELVKDGKIDKKHLSLPAVLEYFKAHPEERAMYMARNDSFAFLKEYDVKEWPSGSLGVQVTPQRSLATDKTIFPRASLTFVAVDKASQDGSAMIPYNGFLLDQDTGGAIKAPGRADIYMGIGPQAGQQAGAEFAQGRLYYMFVKPTEAEAILSRHPEFKRVAGAARPGTAVAPDGPVFPGSP